MDNKFVDTIYDLSGRIALVTGAAGLLGVEHSIALSQSGADVVMTDINMKALEYSAKKVYDLTGATPVTIPLDVCDRKNILSVKERLESDGKIVTILINNAAIDPKAEHSGSISRSSRLEEFDVEKWEAEVKVGLTGAILCSAEFGSGMARLGGGVILNIASDLSVISPDQRLYKKSQILRSEQPVKPVSYSIIKSGLIGLTRYLSTYWSDSNVRCNALSPGGVYTSQEKEFVENISDLIPLGRMAKREEYRGAIQFMCSDASSYLNGQNIIMDGGRSVL
jgi:NAD(P)-dependent dehydrogenase (short-subunit alcohol dehydrogenase family)